jgi:hypothetical protein
MISASAIKLGCVDDFWVSNNSVFVNNFWVNNWLSTLTIPSISHRIRIVLMISKSTTNQFHYRILCLQRISSRCLIVCHQRISSCWRESVLTDKLYVTNELVHADENQFSLTNCMSPTNQFSLPNCSSHYRIVCHQLIYSHCRIVCH